MKFTSVRRAIIDELVEIVGSKRVLTDPESLYVYSFGNAFENKLYQKINVIIRSTSRKEISEIQKLSMKYNLNLILRDKAPKHLKIHGKRETVLIDNIPYPSLTTPEELVERIRKTKSSSPICISNKIMRRDYIREIVPWLLYEYELSRRNQERNLDTGYCTVAPFFDYIDTFSSKGRYLLIRGILRGDLNPTGQIIDTIYSCSLCGLCFADQVQDLEMSNIVLAARRFMANNGLAPQPIMELRKSLNVHGNPFMTTREQRAKWTMDVPRDLQNSRDSDILYFVGCGTSIRTPRIAIATAECLNKAGVKYRIWGEAEKCCGDSLINAGYFEEARDTAKQLVNDIKEMGVNTILTQCSGCYGNFVKNYPHILGIDMPFEILHVTEYLQRLIDERGLKFNKKLRMRVTYHDSCVLGRRCGVYEAPRNVLRSIPSLELIEMKLNRSMSRCCGGGGGLWMLNPSVSLDCARRRLVEDAIPLNVDAIVTACPQCYTTFRLASRRYKLGLEVYDVVELVNMSLDKNTP